MENAKNMIQKSSPKVDDAAEDEPAECRNSARNFKRSTANEEKEEETVVVVRKRGNKVFIEL